MSVIWKALFGALGLGSFLWMLQGYGFARIASDVAHLGWYTVPLALSWLPTLVCYSLSWALVTPELGLKRIGVFVKGQIVTVAWNNLSPFVKVLGEPVRLTMLGRYVDRKGSARSTVLYNMAHFLGTLASFFLGSAFLLLFFPTTGALHAGLLVFLFLMPALGAALFFLPHFYPRRSGRTRRRNHLVVAAYWMRWSFSKIRTFSRRHAGKFWIAVFFETLARFVEGATFYVAFVAIGQAASPGESALLDVGRSLLDNIFFFVPYQVGSREGGIVLLAEHAMRIPAEAAVAAAVFYRLVEIFWMGVGYLLWIQDENAASSSQ